MPQNLDKDGLRSKINSYELFFIDIWGVIHNGLQIFEDSIEVLENLKKNNKHTSLNKHTRWENSNENTLTGSKTKQKYCEKT